MVETFEKESFVWDFGAAVLCAPFDVEGHLLVGFSVHEGGTSHDYNIDWRKILGLESKETVYPRQNRVRIRPIMFNEIIQHPKQSFLLISLQCLDDELSITRMEKERSTCTCSLVSFKNHFTISKKAKWLFDIVRTEIILRHNLYKFLIFIADNTATGQKMETIGCLHRLISPKRFLLISFMPKNWSTHIGTQAEYPIFSLARFIFNCDVEKIARLTSLSFLLFKMIHQERPSDRIFWLCSYLVILPWHHDYGTTP